MAKEPTKGSSRAGRAAFLAKLPEIKTAIEAGEFLQNIHERLKADLPFRYIQFTKYANRYCAAEIAKAMGCEPSLPFPAPEPLAVPAAPEPRRLAPVAPAAPGPKIGRAEPSRKFEVSATLPSKETLI